MPRGRHSQVSFCQKARKMGECAFGTVKSVNLHDTFDVEFANISCRCTLDGYMKSGVILKKGDLVACTKDNKIAYRFSQRDISKHNILELKSSYPVDFDILKDSLHFILKKSLQSSCDYMNTDCLGTIRPYCVGDRTLLNGRVMVYNLTGDLCKIYFIHSYNVRSEKEDLRIWVHDIRTGENIQRECVEELRKIVTDTNLIKDYDVSGIRLCEIRSKASCYSEYPPHTGWYCSMSGDFTVSYEYVE